MQKQNHFLNAKLVLVVSFYCSINCFLQPLILTDPKMKAYISNICNFYHEKTGIWIDSSYNDPIDDQIDYYTLGNEFNQKYGNTMPDSMKEFANMSVLGE